MTSLDADLDSLGKSLKFINEVVEDMDTERPDPTDVSIPLNPSMVRTHFRKYEILPQPDGEKEAAPHDLVAAPSNPPNFTREAERIDPSVAPTECGKRAVSNGFWNIFTLIAERLSDDANSGRWKGLESYIAWEFELLGKTVLQSGSYAHWWADYNLVNDTDPEEVYSDETVEFVTKIAEGAVRFLQAARHDPAWAYSLCATPAGTNHGYPTYRNSDFDLAWHYFLAQRVKTVDDIAILADAFGFPVSGSFFTRTGHMSKGVNEWVLVAGRILSNNLIKGAYPRRRSVMGYPLWLSLALRPEFKALHYARFSLPQTTISTAAASAKYIHRRNGRVVAYDQSGFDSRVSFAAMKRLAQALAPLFGFRGTLGLHEFTFTMPMLTASYLPGLVVLLRHMGYLPSGDPGTSVLGTFHNVCVAIEAVASGRKHASTRETIADLGRKWDLQDLGDDALLELNFPMDEDLFSDKGDKLGFKIAFEQAKTFLMHTMLDADESALVRRYFEAFAIRDADLSAFISKYDLKPGEPFGSMVSYIRARLTPERPKRDSRVELIGVIDALKGVIISPFFVVYCLDYVREVLLPAWGVSTLVDAAALAETYRSELLGENDPEYLDYLNELMRSDRFDYAEKDVVGDAMSNITDQSVCFRFFNEEVPSLSDMSQHARSEWLDHLKGKAESLINP